LPSRAQWAAAPRLMMTITSIRGEIDDSRVEATVLLLPKLVSGGMTCYLRVVPILRRLLFQSDLTGGVVMKKVVLLLFPVFVLLMASSAFADDPKEGEQFTFSGEGQRFMPGEPWYFIEGDYTANFNVDDLKNASDEFGKCVDGGDYAGKIEITAKVKVLTTDGHYELAIDNTSACKRL
jgi:hypothetical protein